MKIHHLKIAPGPMLAVCNGDKTAEFRINDRQYQVGDALIMRIWEVDFSGVGRYGSKEITVIITHIEAGHGITPGYVMLSFKRT